MKLRKALVSVFLYIRWPITIGLIIALSTLLLTRINTPSFENLITLPSSTSNTTAYYQPASFADAVEKASHSVVNIYTKKQVSEKRNPLFDDPIFRHLFNISDIPRQQRMQSTLGSGVIVTKDGYILTNYHVIAGADEIVVALQDGRESKAELMGENRERDLAVLKIDIGKVPPIHISKDTHTRVGDIVLAIGNPFGVGQTVTQGIISATSSRNRSLNISAFEDFIQTDAEIHPGNSGGALIDINGNLLGINTANLSQETGFTGGISFAIPTEIAMQTLKDVVKFGRVVKGWLGVEAVALTPRLAHELGLQTTTGVVVTKVTTKGPAEKAGLVSGDIVVGIQGQPISSPVDIIQLIQESRPGDKVKLELIRSNELKKLTVTLAEKPAEPIPSESPTN